MGKPTILFFLLFFSGCITGVEKLDFDYGETKENYDFIWAHAKDPYLIKLKNNYRLYEIIEDSHSDLERVQRICHWVHTLWKHSGSNTPEKNDPISIIEEAKKGKRFRCVEYAVVASACLNAVGIPARVLALKTKDVETRASGAGHVVAEAFLKDQGKWVFLDPQWDVIPLLNDLPLNAVEFQDALSKRSPGLKLISLSGITSFIYYKFVKDYLYYFDVHLDTRVWETNRARTKLMLVPSGAREPHVFQRKWPIKNVIYTHSVKAFYPHP